MYGGWPLAERRSADNYRTKPYTVEVRIEFLIFITKNHSSQFFSERAI